MRTLPPDYVAQKFLQYAGYPRYKKYSQIYEGGCPTCREGNSWGRKRRLYFIVKQNFICCHNCGSSFSPYDWIKDVCHLTDKEILSELSERDFVLVNEYQEEPEEEVERRLYTLPEDSINLLDESQVRFYKDNYTVQKVLEYIKKRKLDTACNAPKTLWLTLKDKIHRNRLIIPFYDNNKIVYYQSRTVLEKDSQNYPKYLSKLGDQKTLFGFDSIDTSKNNYYVFEGPIDAFFCKNSVAVAGIQERSDKLFTYRQQEQLKKLFLMERVWVLDSQYLDSASRNKSKILLDIGEKVFIWPEEYGNKFKDFNDMCTKLKLSEIPESFIAKNTYTQLKGRVKLSVIERINPHH